MEKYIFGVDIGGTTIKFGLFQTEGRQGKLLEKWKIPTRIQHGGAYVLPDAVVSIKNVMEKYGISDNTEEPGNGDILS